MINLKNLYVKRNIFFFKGTVIKFLNKKKKKIQKTIKFILIQFYTASTQPVHYCILQSSQAEVEKLNIVTDFPMFIGANVAEHLLSPDSRQQIKNWVYYLNLLDICDWILATKTSQNFIRNLVLDLPLLV